MNAAGYFTAAIPEPFQILGIQLKPLSLGRYRLLRRFGVAFVSEETKGAGPSDLILGVIICSMRCNEFLQFLDSPGFTNQINAWGRSVFPHSWIGRIPIIGKWWNDRHAFNLFEKLQLFQRYIESHSKIPNYWDETGESGASSANWANSLDVVLRSDLNWTEDEINETSLSKAFTDYFRWAESQGAIRLMDDAEEETARQNAEAIKAARQAALC